MRDVFTHFEFEIINQIKDGSGDFILILVVYVNNYETSASPPQILFKLPMFK